ncbi:MAG: hypothetical protein K9M49_07915 [Candidatus Marinimicrobia bacterium]|nr:hypothetical protein [Candidatus Neomarinimicrobiota bacterium]MCF7851341.1 hypothetical protein [Candidatus Neomarinimicrobiota bacterium]MCF7905065.1 hypothetical protein [Candidatus Neomarinimicrobiota bacterium]
MKRLNAYYLISIITLAFMFLILMRTLEAIGWFEDDEERRSSQNLMLLAGAYEMMNSDSGQSPIPVDITARYKDGERWMDVLIDGQLSLGLRFSDFENDQVLLEIFRVDTMGNRVRIDGCECPLSQDGLGSWEGTTLGEFCAYEAETDRYLAIRFVGDKTASSVIIESRDFEEKTLIEKQEYFLRRRASHE